MCFALVIALAVALLLSLSTFRRGLNGRVDRTSGRGCRMWSTMQAGVIMLMLLAVVLGVGGQHCPPAFAGPGAAGQGSSDAGTVHSERARRLGVGKGRIMLRYVLPAVFPQIFRHAMLRLPGVALALAALGFLGLGPQPPHPDWGLILAEGMPYVERSPLVVLVAAFALVLLSVLAVSISSVTVHVRRGRPVRRRARQTG
ncbi:ABC transporter permease subunit [Arthrobacter sp. ISL-30]|uniref:ABC transporter permease subunit n=1 Tax=Arthrobacter sp. ISL-30 TaxID=2819109 RepID=UPI001BECE1AB|nr:ABC transporter permease subunit [Arthrobacter sp. ISL-30]MBT2513515.1 ABC transporter permease subunit [Arthrobacter sp. ISL-30]